MQVDLDRLQRILGYVFKNPRHLKQALTHCSAGSENYERFEFFGDSILGFVIAHELFLRFPKESEGQLSRMRSFLVKGDKLAEIALDLNLGDFLHLGQGELKSGGFRRASILADAFEAIIAAIFLDAGLEQARAFILKAYERSLSQVSPKHGFKDFKTRLQEQLQSQKFNLPQYRLIHAAADEDEPLFRVTCEVKGIEFTAQGEDSTRRKAEQKAAAVFLAFLTA